MYQANPIHNRFMRLSMYIHERQHGVTLVVRRKLAVVASTETGQTTWTITQWKIPRVVVLPEKRQREVRQNAGAMAANRAIMQGSSSTPAAGTFCSIARRFPAIGAAKGRLDRLQQQAL